MADQTNGASGRGAHGEDDEPRRPKAAWSTGLADEAADAFPALAIIGVGIALIAGLIQGGVSIPGLGTSPNLAVTAVAADVDEEPVVEEPEEEEVEEPEEEAVEVVEELDLAGLESSLTAGGFSGIALSVAGGVVTATGELPDEAARAELLDLLAAQPGVEGVIDQTTIAAPVVAAAVDVTASQASIVLAGTVPSQAVADELAARALQIYRPDQVDNQLVVDESVAPPISVTMAGSTTDQSLYNRLLTAFDGIVGIDSVDISGLTLEESSDLEAALLALPFIEFASGSAQILPESAVILDQAATILAQDPAVSIEIGGHTDSRGSAESNQALSQARADAVQAALIERGVLNEMVARGFGEDRLKVNPEVTAEDQQANRRIEFRIL